MKKYTEKNPHPLGKEFPIINLTRADLIDADYPKKKVMALTDDDMENLASEMQDGLMNDFWETLDYATQKTLNLKKKR